MGHLRFAAETALAAAAFLGLSACETNSVALTGRTLARAPEAAQLRTIAVLDFERDADGFTSLLRSELQGAALDGRPWFTLVSDAALLADAGFYRRAPDLKGAIGAARERGVDALYLGEVSDVQVWGSSREEKHKRCVEWDGLFDCETREEYWTTCHDVSARYAVGLEVVDTRTGALAFADAFDAHEHDSYCDDQSRWVDPGTLVAAARSSVAQQIRHAVAPSNVTLRARFKPEAPVLPEAEAAAFENGVAFAREGQMDRACAIWRGLAPDDRTESPALLQNLAVCAEVEGDHDRALALYDAAASRLARPDDDVERARRRVIDQSMAFRLTR